MLTERAGWPAGHDLTYLGTVPSTMETARALGQHAGRPHWVAARAQSAGQARRGRGWASPEGTLAVTLVLRPACGPGELALYSFVAALALQDALAHWLPGAALALKWPNDVLVQGGKAAGILLQGEAGQAPRLFVGIGVNLNAAPSPGVLEPGALAPVCVAEAAGTGPIDPLDMLTRLACAFEARAATFAAEGFAPIRAAWLAGAARLGQPLSARLGHETVSGRFETVDAAGQLILDTGQGLRAIAAADVFFP